MRNELVKDLQSCEFEHSFKTRLNAITYANIKKLMELE